MPHKRTQQFYFKANLKIFNLNPANLKYLTIQIPQDHGKCWQRFRERPASKFCPCLARLIHSFPPTQIVCPLFARPCCYAAKDKCIRPTHKSCRNIWQDTRGLFTSAHAVIRLMDGLYDTHNRHRLSENGILKESLGNIDFTNSWLTWDLSLKISLERRILLMKYLCKMKTTNQRAIVKAQRLECLYNLHLAVSSIPSTILVVSETPFGVDQQCNTAQSTAGVGQWP